MTFEEEKEEKGEEAPSERIVNVLKW